MRGEHKQSHEYKMQHWINNVGLQIHNQKFNEEEILDNQPKPQNSLKGRKEAERNCSRNRNKNLIESQSHLLWFSNQEVLEFRSIQDENGHWENHSRDLHEQENVHLLRAQSAQVVEKTAF